MIHAGPTPFSDFGGLRIWFATRFIKGTMTRVAAAGRSTGNRSAAMIARSNTVRGSMTDVDVERPRINGQSNAARVSPQSQSTRNVPGFASGSSRLKFMLYDRMGMEDSNGALVVKDAKQIRLKKCAPLGRMQCGSSIRRKNVYTIKPTRRKFKRGLYADEPGCWVLIPIKLRHISGSMAGAVIYAATSARAGDDYILITIIVPEFFVAYFVRIAILAWAIFEMIPIFYLRPSSTSKVRIPYSKLIGSELGARRGPPTGVPLCRR